MTMVQKYLGSSHLFTLKPKSVHLTLTFSLFSYQFKHCVVKG